jgi:multidrug resistance protein, MATE family
MGMFSKMSNYKVLMEDIKELLIISIPLIGSMLSGLLMMIVDHICLSQYSKETLAASGPAIFTAMTIIMFFVGVAGITRVFVAQAKGQNNERHIAIAAFSGIIISVIIGIVLVMLRPLIILIPELSSRPEIIKILERDFLGITPYYGFFMILNSCFGSIFNGVLQTRVTMVVGIIGNVLNAIFTAILVFGYLGFPELGMKGSAYGTLIAASTNTLIYIVLLSKSNIFTPLFEKEPEKNKIFELISRTFRVGIPSGAAQALDEAGQTAFVWIVGGISLSSLMANNVGLAVNLIIIIPLIGLGIGNSILIANKIGAGERERTISIVKAAFCIAFIYISIMTMLELCFAHKFVLPFVTSDIDIETLTLANTVVKILFTYAIGFAFSMIMGGALEAVGMTKHVFWIRAIVIWGISLPIIYFVVNFNMNQPYIVPICWLIFSGFELLIGLICGVFFLHKGRNQQMLVG